MSNYVLTTFRFQVDWGGTNIGFSEVSGMDFETDVVEYTHGAMLESTPMKSPGKPKYGNITLKRGVFRNDSEAYDWMKAIRTEEDARRNITITMLDQNQNPVLVWRVQNAWVSKLTTPNLNAGSSEAAVEQMDVVCESYSLEYL